MLYSSSSSSSCDIETNPGSSVEKSLDIFHFNIQSIRNKIDSLMYLGHDFDILCSTETYWDFSVLNENLLIEGFNKMQKRKCNCYFGRVMIFVSNFKKANRKEDLKTWWYWNHLDWNTTGEMESSCMLYLSSTTL